MNKLEGRQLENSTQVLNRVFIKTDSLGVRFRPEIDRRAILFPIPEKLDEAEWNALIYAVAAIGEDQVSLRCFQSVPDPPTWILAPGEFTKYSILTREYAFRESAVYSVNGKWGLLISPEDHAVIGGGEKFVTALIEKWPQPIAPQVREFLEHYEGRSRYNEPEPRWLPPLLDHVYGPDEAQRLLEESRKT